MASSLGILRAEQKAKLYKMSGCFSSPSDKPNGTAVARIMKKALPKDAKVSEGAEECMQKCVSEFISFVTSEGKGPIHLALCHATPPDLHA